MHITREEFEREIARLDERIDLVAEFTQADVDAITAELAAAETAIQSEISNLEAQISAGTPPASLDLTALKAAADGISGIAASTVSASGSAPSSASSTQTGGEATATGSTEPAPSDSSAQGSDASSSGSTEPSSGTVTDATPAATLYTSTLDPSTIDTTNWPLADVVTTDGQALYTYMGDTSPGAQNGATVPGWSVYAGTTVPATAPSAPAATSDAGNADPGILG